jgi:hypothetical protein
MSEPCDWCYGTGWVSADPNEIDCDCPAVFLSFEVKQALAGLRCQMLCLARNLRDAAGLCEAFSLGRYYDDPYPYAAEAWRPGCGRDVKGGE